MSQPMWDVDADTIHYLRVQDLETFLRDRGLGQAVAVFPGGPGLPIPEDPGPLLVVTFMPGFGYDGSGVIEHGQFQVRTVGPQFAHEETQELAHRVDRVLAPQTGHGPLTLNTLHVVEIARTAGPQLLFRDDGNRFHYVCTYAYQIEAYK